MQDDKIDNILREAAAQYHPPYDDKSWAKMELLLDRHLPQKKGRRKLWVFLLLFLLIDACIFLAMVQPWKNGSASLAKEQTPNISSPAETGNKDASGSSYKNGTLNKDENNNDPNSIASNANVEDPSGGLPVLSSMKNKNPTRIQTGDILLKDKTDLPGVIDKAPSNNSKVDALSSGKPLPGRKATDRSNFQSNKIKAPLLPAPSLAEASAEKSPAKTSPSSAKKIKRSNNGKLRTTIGSPVLEEDKTTEALTSSVPKTAIAEMEPIAETNTSGQPQVATEKKSDPEIIQSIVIDTASLVTKKNAEPAIPSPIANAENKKKTYKGFRNNFAVSVSMGPEMSYVKLNDPGSTRFLYGAGLSYSIGEHLLLRTGLYVANKVYSATPEQYTSYANPNPYLQKIDASCRILEIPLNLSYGFAKRKNHQWFAGAGLSSFLMKTEDYTYIYKGPSGQVYDYKHAVKNENNHYFSVLSLSGGYQYQINKKLSLMAEPYVKLPLKGVGLGKIKLNSAGLLFSISYKPFAKKD